MSRTPTTLLTLTAKDEAILRAVCRYRFLTSLDIAHLLFKPSYLPYVRGRLARLAEGQPHAYLHRFRLPTPTGNGDLIYTLGAKGREFAERELGAVVDWHFQPHKLKFFSYSGVLHHLLLTRFLVACRVWCRERDDYRLLAERTSYEIARQPPKVTLTQNNKKLSLPVIPDAWMHFDRLERGEHTQYLALLVELDRGMEHSRKFKEHVRGRIELIRSGEYQRVFGVPGVLVAYLTTGQTPEYRTTRMKTMNAWTREVLRELGLESWAAIFRFAAVEFEHLYGSVGALFAEPVWYRPDAPLTPVPLVPA